MHPQPSPHGMTHHPQQLSTPGAVWGMAAMLWCTAGILFTEFAVNMITAPLYGVELDYAFFYSLPRALVGVFVLVPAVPVTRGRPWARTMAKTVLIIQIVLQSMALLASNADMWTLFLFPMAIIGTVLLGRPSSRWFFHVHKQAADQQKHPQQHGAQQWGHGSTAPAPHPPQHTYPQPQPYEQYRRTSNTHRTGSTRRRTETRAKAPTGDEPRGVRRDDTEPSVHSDHLNRWQP